MMKADTLTINCGQPITSLAPIDCVSTHEANAVTLLYRGLYKIQNKGIVGDLVLNETPDDSYQTWLITLHQAQWSTGEPITAYDLYHTWHKALETQSAASYMLLHIAGARDVFNGDARELSGIDIVDETTLELSFIDPVPHFPELACHAAFSPMSCRGVHSFSKDNFEAGETLATSGNYVIRGWTRDRLVLEATTDSRPLRQITFSSYDDYDDILCKLRTGEIDVHDGGPIGNSPVSAELRRYLKHYPILGTFYLYLNTEKSELQSKELRRCLAATIDRSIFSQVDGRTSTTYLIPDYIAHWNREAPPGGLIASEDMALRPLDFICNDEAAYVEIAEKIIGNWEAATGIKFNLLVLPWEDYLARLEAGEFDVARGGWVADYQDPLAFFEMFASDSPTNYSRWRHPTFNNLFQKARCVGDRQARNVLYQELEKIIAEEAPMVPLYFFKVPQLIGPRIKSFSITHTGLINYDSILLKGGD